MRVCCRFALLGCLIVALLPTPAAAGGWWSSINPDKYYVSAGQDFKAETQFLFASSQEAQIARTEGGFYAYLVTGLDRQMFTDAMNEDFSPDWWSLQGATAIRVGTVVVAGGSSNLARARARMNAPEVAPGVYQLMFCDARCVHPMGDVVPATVTVVEDPFVARLAN